MRRNHQTNGFWEPGFSIRRDELAKQEKAALSPLKAELKTATESRRKEDLKKRIAAVKAEFREKRKDSECSLF